jgi:hypothetical protein
LAEREAAKTAEVALYQAVRATELAATAEPQRR